MENELLYNTSSRVTSDIVFDRRRSGKSQLNRCYEQNKRAGFHANRSVGGLEE